jgi:hypothetical protein
MTDIHYTGLITVMTPTLTGNAKMSNDFKKTRINASGSIAPILLVGVVADGKETKFLELISSEAGKEKPFVVETDLFEVSTQEVLDAIPVSTVDGALSKVEASSKEHSSVIAVFTSADECIQRVAIDLLQKITAKENDKVTYVLSCEKIPDFIESDSNLKNQLQIIQFELPPKPPVLQVHELEESPLHEYCYYADFLAKYPQQINDPKDAQLLNSLADLMKAVEGIEGGILGQEAHDRGMDGSVIQSLAAFSRVFKGSSNELADSIARSVIKELLACPVVPKFTEVNPQKKQPAPDTPSLG